jgi:glucosylceramidase
MIKKSVIYLYFILSTLSLSAQQATIYTTAKDTNLRLSETDKKTFVTSKQPVEVQSCIFIDTKHQYQTILGIGSAITDASAETFYNLSKNLQQEILTAFYDRDKGIGYSFVRTSINSCDFSRESYTYVRENDTALASFNISHDLKYRIPLIKKAINTAGVKLPVLISPWSPPAWMKDNNNMLQGGALLPAYYQTWANYFIKFIQAYENQNIPIWGLTVQNEPMAKQTWESCIYTAQQEGNFVKNYLGPTLSKAGYDNKKLIIWDHNRDLIYHRASTILNDPEISKYVWGIGYHWYETWTGSNMMFDNVQQTKEAFPGKHLLFTEGCVEKFDIDRVHDWKLGERYGYSMINDFNQGVEAWIDWNIILNEHGGPNHAGNFCFAPIVADTKHNKLIYTNIYYYIGHFSKFVQPDAKRISAGTNRDGLLTCAFQNPDNTIVVVVMNIDDKLMNNTLFLNKQMTTIESLPHSILTIVIAPSLK